MPDISFSGLLAVAVIAVTAPLLVNLSVGLDAVLTRLQDTTARSRISAGPPGEARATSDDL